MASLVSVVIPAYNCAKYVAESIQSALDQDYPDKEIIVVNDGSTDDTLEVVRQFGDAVRIIDQPNSGPPAARNAGLRAVRGDYVAFLDGDDVWVPGKIAAQVGRLVADPGLVATYSTWHIWNADTDGIFRRPDWFDRGIADDATDPLGSGWIYNRLLDDCIMLTTTVVIRGTAVKQVGEFDGSLFSGEDYDYWLRLSRIGRIDKLAAVGALYRVLPNSVSRRPQPVNFEHRVVSRALEQWGRTGPDGEETDLAKMTRRLDRLTATHGYAHLRNGDPGIALAAFRELLAHRPLQPKLWARTAQAFMKRLAMRPQR